MSVKTAMMMKGIPGKVVRVRGYSPLKIAAAIRMQLASTEAEKENMAPEDINIQVNKDVKQTSREIQLNQA